MSRFAVLVLGCALAQAAIADEKVEAKIAVVDSTEWFHSKFVDPSSGWAECALTFCKSTGGETEVFSYAATDPTHYLRRSNSPMSRASQSRNRARLNDNRNYGSEHWHCEQDIGHLNGCKCICAPDTNCYSVQHSDRFVKVCDGQEVEVQYTKSKHHKAIIASIDAGVALIAGTNGVGHACRAGTYNTDGIGACKPHTKCSAGQELTGESATTPGSCTGSPTAPTLPAAFAECTTLMKASNFAAAGFKWDPHQHNLDVRGKWSDISGNDNHAMSTTKGIKPSDWRQCSDGCQESRYPLPESHWAERYGPDSGVHLKHSAGNGAAASIPYVQGGMETMIEWPEGTLPPLFTVCTVTRYAGALSEADTDGNRYIRGFTDPVTGTFNTVKVYPGSLTHGTQTTGIYWGRQSRGELVQSDAGAAMGGTMRPNYVRAPGMTVDGAARQRTRKWSHGHSEGRVGVAKYAHWKTAAAAVAPEFLDPPRNEDNAFSPDTDWLIHCGQNGGTFAQLVDVEGTTVNRKRVSHWSNTPYGEVTDWNAHYAVDGVSGIGGPGNLFIDAAYSGGWAAAEIAIWDRALSETEMNEIVDYYRTYLSTGVTGTPAAPTLAAGWNDVGDNEQGDCTTCVKNFATPLSTQAIRVKVNNLGSHLDEYSGGAQMGHASRDWFMVTEIIARDAAGNKITPLGARTDSYHGAFRSSTFAPKLYDDNLAGGRSDERAHFRDHATLFFSSAVLISSIEMIQPTINELGQATQHDWKWQAFGGAYTDTA